MLKCISIHFKLFSGWGRWGGGAVVPLAINIHRCLGLRQLRLLRLLLLVLLLLLLRETHGQHRVAKRHEVANPEGPRGRVVVVRLERNQDARL